MLLFRTRPSSGVCRPGNKSAYFSKLIIVRCARIKSFARQNFTVSTRLMSKTSTEEKALVKITQIGAEKQRSYHLLLIRLESLTALAATQAIVLMLSCYGRHCKASCIWNAYHSLLTVVTTRDITVSFVPSTDCPTESSDAKLRPQDEQMLDALWLSIRLRG